MLRRFITNCARLVIAVIALLWLVAVAAADDPPRRIVSFNLCADQLVVALADPEQIVGLSPHAAEPKLSAVAEQARAFRRLPWQAESTIRYNPDLVLVGAFDGTAVGLRLDDEYVFIPTADRIAEGLAISKCLNWL